VPTFRLLHLSDLHLAARKRRLRQSRFDPAVLEELARSAYFLRDHYDAFLISGDLGDSGGMDDLELAFDFLYATAQPSSPAWLSARQKPTLQAAGKPIFLMPGNHDRYRSWPGGDPAGRNFDSVFSGGWSVGVTGVQGIPLPSKNNPFLWLLFADFTLAREGDATGSVGKWGQGYVYEDRLRDLVSNTSAAQANNAAVVWVIHFAPEFENHYQLKDSLRLLLGGSLMRKARDLNIRHIFCGHTHQRKVYPERPPFDVSVHCAGTACCRAHNEDTSFHLVEIDVAAGQVTEVREKNVELTESGEFK
jgi:DNA repair exonuclease SbcCD nuclease subunit